jgi:guanyl-specific ribonuclease Sa
VEEVGDEIVDSTTKHDKLTDTIEAGSDAVPQKAKDIAEQVKNNNGRAPDGYQGGRTFKNDGRRKQEVLPKIDSSGNPIVYKEYDVNPRQPGVNRGSERIVVGSDGNAYYTSDHYISFTRI